MTLQNNEPKMETNLTQQCYYLRPIEQSDLDSIANWYQQVEDVSVFDRQVPLPINKDEVKQIISDQIRDRAQNRCYWFVAEDEHNNAVGMTGLEQVSNIHGSAIVPIFVDSQWRRSGIGIRLLCLMMEMAFKQLRLHRISTVYRADNKASETLIKQCGFVQEGVARQAWFGKGEYFDLINVGVLAKEWEQIRVELSNSMNPETKLCLGPRATPEWCWPIVDN